MPFFQYIHTLHKKHRRLSHIIFWAAIFIISIAEDSYYYRESLLMFNRINYFALNLVTQVIMAYFLAYFIIPRFFNTKKYLSLLICLIAGSYIICVLARMINIHVHEPLSGVAPKSFETVTEVMTDFQKLFLVYFIRNFSIAVVFLFLKLLIDQFGIQQRTLSLEKAKAETELKLLKAQLNPHFLFNTLNNIYSLSLHNSPRAPESIARLSDILDHMLYRCNSLYVPLSTEITLLKNYIELEKLRYDERLQVKLNTTIEYDADVAPLLILSLTENAFKHGAGEDAGSPAIEIDIQVKSNVFTCRVANTFFTESNGEKQGKIGLQNLRQQLELLYPGTHTLTVEQTGNLFIVTLIISLQPQMHV